MAIRVSCTECGKKLSVRDELAGKKVKCPGCATVFTAEADEAETAVKATPPRLSPAAQSKDKVSAKPMSKRPAPPPMDDDDPDDRPVRAKHRKDEDDEEDDDRASRSRGKKVKKKAGGRSLLGLWLALGGVLLLGGGLGGYFLFFGGSGGGGVAVAAKGGNQNAQPNPVAANASISELIPGDAWLFVSVSADVWNAKALESVRNGLGAQFEKFTQDNFGIAWPDVDRISVFSIGEVNPKMPQVAAPIAGMVQFRKAMDQTAVSEAFHKSGFSKDTRLGMMFLNDRTAIIGQGPFFAIYKDKLGKHRASGPLQTALAQAATSKGLVASMVIPPQVMQQQAQMLQNLPPENAVFAKMQAFTATVDLTDQLVVKATMIMEDAGSAQQGKKAMESQLAQLGGLVALMVPDKEAAKAIQQALNGLKLSAQDKDITMTYQADGAAVADMIAGILSKAPPAAAAAASGNNLKQIGLAWHNYLAVNKTFPPQTNGKGLSWRVMILPYIEQDTLFKQFKLDESWDSPHNKNLIQFMPREFESPGRAAQKGFTYYQTFVGPNTVNADKFKGSSIGAITDGTSNTLIVAEAEKALEWTRPDDIAISPSAPIALGSSSPNGTLAAFADGSVRYIPRNVTQQVLRWLIDPKDGNTLPKF